MSARELIDAIVADPHQEAAWMIYADWLLERGDIRGELIHLALNASDEADRRIRLLEIDEEPLLSPELREQRQHWYLTWKRGFIDSASTDGAVPFAMAALEALSADPHAGLLREITIDGFSHQQRHLVREPDPEHETPIVPNLTDSSSFGAFRYLEKLYIANIRMARLSHPHLRKLEQYESTGTFSHTGLFDLPMLTDWSLFGDDELYTTRTSILYRPPPLLHALSISVSPSQVALLSDLPIIQQLHTLQLEVNELEALLVLRDRAASFGHLRSIVLPYIGRADDVPAARELRSDLERAFPNTKLEIEWQRIFGEGDFAPLPAVPDVPTVIVDAQSRTPDGRIDPVGAWNQSGPDDD